MTDVQDWLDGACGRKEIDLLIKDVRWLDVFSGEFKEGDLGVHRGRFTGPGKYRAKSVLKGDGLFLVPGFIDAHCHLESTMLTPLEFAKAVLPRGTTAVVADPHEIANVLGLEGILLLVRMTRGVPFRFRFTLPSCVPASGLETSGASLSARDLELFSREPWVAGLGEVMNFPGVIHGDPDVHEKLKAFRHLVIDGHAPGLSGEALNGYVASGIHSDHECTTLQEASEKLSRGMWIMIREGTSAKNLEALLPLVNERSVFRCMVVTDDRSPEDLQEKGHLDQALNKAIELGLDPILALRMVTINPASYFGLHELGAIAPGRLADAVLLESIKPIEVSAVMVGGTVVWHKNRGFRRLPKTRVLDIPRCFEIGPLGLGDLKVRAEGRRMRLMEVIPGQILTAQRWIRPLVKDGEVVSDLSRDVLKVVVVERHKGTGNRGIGFVKGFGIKTGAIGSSVAHDSHNVVAVGTTDQDILVAIREIEKMKGGIVAVAQGRVVARLPLPIAGLISPWPLKKVVEAHRRVRDIAVELGCGLEDPFMHLSFLALPVIPDLKITDKGLVDVRSFKVVGLFHE